MKEKETTAMDLILGQQKEWAKDKTLVSGKIIDGEECEDKNYLETIEDNIFPVDNTKGLTPKNIKAYNKGGGCETKTITHRPKMSALHSSSALVVNLFQYWQEKKDITPLLKALMGNKCPKILKNIEINFESKIFPIKINNKTIATPNIDITITYKDENENKYVIAIESKFTEPYKSKTYQGLGSKQYNDDSLWNNLPNIKEKRNITTKHLDYPQLIKHILGLKSILKSTEKFTLLYLWYDVPGTEEAKKHQEEIEAFASIAKADGIDFRHITYQKVISYLKKNYKNEHKDYIDYLVERYYKHLPYEKNKERNFD